MYITEHGVENDDYDYDEVYSGPFTSREEAITFLNEHARGLGFIYELNTPTSAPLAQRLMAHAQSN